jgi:hypothetical protein
MSDRYEDARGVIQDLFDGEPVDAVTHITTLKGTIRGNHYHEHTTQWTLVLSGRLLIANPAMQKIVPHAWEAIEDASCLVFTRGPRSGENYESDTYRLDEPLLT